MLSDAESTASAQSQETALLEPGKYPVRGGERADSDGGRDETRGGDVRSMRAPADRYSFFRSKAYAFFSATSLPFLPEKSWDRNVTSRESRDALASALNVDHLPKAA